MKKNPSGKIAIFVADVILLAIVVFSACILFNRMTPYYASEFKNVLSLTGEDGGRASGSNLAVVWSESYHDEDGGSSNVQADNSNEQKVGSEAQSGQNGNSDSNTGSSGSQGFEKHHEFHMEAEAEIFRLSYDNETGKTTVIGPKGNKDKLIAPGTTNLYQFTLRNSGDVALRYILTMEAYVTGTDLWIPVNARVWDYTNKYLVGSSSEMADVMELNTVEEKAGLGAGRHAVYNLEWEWPFERADSEGDINQGDEYDTMLGNLAVDEDLVLHIVIRTVAEYDEDPDDPDAGELKPPLTGDEASILSLALICGFSLLGLCAMILSSVKSGRDRYKEENAE